MIDVNGKSDDKISIKNNSRDKTYIIIIKKNSINDFDLVYYITTAIHSVVYIQNKLNFNSRNSMSITK